MSDLRARHTFLGQLGIMPWYPRLLQAGAPEGVRYSWSHPQTAGQPSAHLGKRTSESVGQLLESLKNAETAADTEGGRAAREVTSEADPRPKDDLVNLPQAEKSEQAAELGEEDGTQAAVQAICLGVIQAGDWQFCIACKGESELAIELEAAGKIVSGIRKLAGWQPPETRTFVWPPLDTGPRRDLSPAPLLQRFQCEVQAQPVRYQVLAGPEDIWQTLEAWPEAEKRLQIEGEGMSWVLSDAARKRRFWSDLQALCR
ncbi:MAG: hypothetical protein D6758_06070 [Gammaproteobacteria bacterium]|nr:MAG: hypothetical protein D6758_06070 [Gammaproteobacteria bacterium]